MNYLSVGYVFDKFVGLIQHHQPTLPTHTGDIESLTPAAADAVASTSTSSEVRVNLEVEDSTLEKQSEENDNEDDDEEEGECFIPTRYDFLAECDTPLISDVISSPRQGVYYVRRVYIDKELAYTSKLRAFIVADRNSPLVRFACTYSYLKRESNEVAYVVESARPMANLLPPSHAVLENHEDEKHLLSLHKFYAVHQEVMVAYQFAEPYALSHAIFGEMLFDNMSLLPEWAAEIVTHHHRDERAFLPSSTLALRAMHGAQQILDTIAKRGLLEGEGLETMKRLADMYTDDIKAYERSILSFTPKRQDAFLHPISSDHNHSHNHTHTHTPSTSSFSAPVYHTENGTKPVK